MSNANKPFRRSLLYNILTSGTYDSYEISTRSRIIFLNTVIFVGVATLVSFSTVSYFSNNLSLSIATASASLVLVFGFVFIRATRRFVVGDYIASLSIFLLYCYLYLSGGEQGSGILWLFSFPLIALFLHRIKIGSLMSGILLLVILAGLFIPEVGTWQFSMQYGLRIIGSYIFIFLFGLVYEIVRNITQNNLYAANRELQQTAEALSQEKSQTDAVFKNVKEGIFLMDEQFRILPSYSRFLEDLLETGAIANRSLTEILTPYLNTQAVNALQDYLPMLLNDSLNPELIHDINPLEEIKLVIPVSEGSFREKTLQFSFELVKIGAAEQHILTVVYDITTQVELTARMAAEQQRHLREMETLFQVLHVDPQLMAEFIEDTEQELDSINAMLRDKGLDTPSTLQSIFQSIHSIKGNALLLGLESFGITLHGLEQHIKEILDLPNPIWRDMLQLTADIGGIQQAIEDTKTIIEKLVNFQSASKAAGLSQAGLLERALRRIADRESRVRERPGKIEFSGIEILPEHYRRSVRDILIQLIRNSYAHGIEPAEIRTQNGKAEISQLHVSIRNKDDGIEIVYQDDGAGVDFDKVEKQARTLELFPTAKTMEGDESGNEKELIRLLFHPRFTTVDEENLSAGQGMGLPFVHAQVREMGGKISINSRSGQGVRFSIFIPQQPQ